MDPEFAKEGRTMVIAYSASHIKGVQGEKPAWSWKPFVYFHTKRGQKLWLAMWLFECDFNRFELTKWQPFKQHYQRRQYLGY